MSTSTMRVSDHGNAALLKTFFFPNFFALKIVVCIEMQPTHSMGICLLFGVVLTVVGADDVVDDAEAEETKGQ